MKCYRALLPLSLQVNVSIAVHFQGSKPVMAAGLRAFPCIFSHSFPFLNSLTLALLSTSKEVRAAGLRAFRHMFSDEVGLAKILACRIDIFITRFVLGFF